MNISYNWLKEYVSFDLTPGEVAEALTSIGLEVGAVEEVQSIKGGLEGIVIGEVFNQSKGDSAASCLGGNVEAAIRNTLPFLDSMPDDFRIREKLTQKVSLTITSTTIEQNQRRVIVTDSSLNLLAVAC